MLTRYRLHRLVVAVAIALGLAIGCSASSSPGDDGGSGSSSCAQSGSFTITVFAGAGGALGDACACQPSSMSVAVTWGADGSATVDGQSCGTLCYAHAVAGGAATAFGYCRDLGLPPADSSCFVAVGCCVAWVSSSSATGEPMCGKGTTYSVANVSFSAKSGQSPTDVRVLPANAATLNYTGCECLYCGAGYGGSTGKASEPVGCK